MELSEKAKIFHEHLLTEKTTYFLQDNDPQNKNSKEPLKVWSKLISCLLDEDFNGISLNNIFLNVIFSPATCSFIQVNIPKSSKVINIDYNSLINCSQDQRVAIILHEYGHAFNPLVKYQEGEFVADDFAFDRGYGAALLESLEWNIKHKADEFDNDTNSLRVTRLTKKLVDKLIGQQQ